MQLGEAIAAIDSLANGIDPVTGRPLPDSGPYHHPQVIRALFTVLRHLRDQGATSDGAVAEVAMPNVARKLPERVGKPWTPAEDEQLIAEFHAAVEFREMAKMHGRTRGAIVSRLTKLGEIQPKYVDPSSDSESNWEVLKENRAHAGKPWTSEHDAALIRHYDAGLPLEEIAERLQRGVKAVEVRLIKLGKLEVGEPYVEFDV